MSAKVESKKFGKGTRSVPHHSEKAQKWYPAEADAQPRKRQSSNSTNDNAAELDFRQDSQNDGKATLGILRQEGRDIRLGAFGRVRKAVRAWQPRKTLQPGTILILLAGRFRGKRVVLLKNLDQGVLLVTGPFKINGVPLRRVNSRYVIATSQKVDLAGVDDKKIEEIAQPKYFVGEKTKEKAGEEAFFKQGEKAQKKEVSSTRAADQKAIDKSLLANIKKVEFLASYLASSFSLRKGDKPHEMKW